ncbi:hypothetical protein C8R45DRAFT_929781 [Mycena sanguinolenta]|nr:hypothetical protein C8R45DRAFT_929781 [Mycena sanguinolenta]
MLRPSPLFYHVPPAPNSLDYRLPSRKLTWYPFDSGLGPDLLRLNFVTQHSTLSKRRYGWATLAGRAIKGCVIAGTRLLWAQRDLAYEDPLRMAAPVLDSGQVGVTFSAVYELVFLAHGGMKRAEEFPSPIELERLNFNTASKSGYQIKPIDSCGDAVFSFAPRFALSSRVLGFAPPAASGWRGRRLCKDQDLGDGRVRGVEDGVAHNMEMDVDADDLSFPSSPVLTSLTPAPADGSPLADDAPPPPTEAQAQAQANAKGKQRVVDPPPPRRPHTHAQKARKQHREKRERVYTLPDFDDSEEPGFVWNQGLFVPPYIKDRCASPLPPSLPCLFPPSLPSSSSLPSLPPFFFVLGIRSTYPIVLSFTHRRRIHFGSGSGSGSVSSTNSALSSSSMNEYNNYEVEVVEIRVQEGEFAGIIP